MEGGSVEDGMGCRSATSASMLPRTKQNEGMLAMFAASSQIPQLKSALTDRLEKQRDYILTTYCETPAVLGGDPI